MTDSATKRPFTGRGNYLRIYRKQLNGAWKVSRDMRASIPSVGAQE